MIITLQHMRAARVCPRAKVWFKMHDLDWKDFVKNGIPEEKLLATNDPRVLKFLEIVNGIS